MLAGVVPGNTGEQSVLGLPPDADAFKNPRCIFSSRYSFVALSLPFNAWKVVDCKCTQPSL